MISTHILDTSNGKPAAEIPVRLERFENETWNLIDEQSSNGDGRIVFNCPFEEGVYRLLFEIDAYFEKNNQDHFFLRTPVVFKITDVKRKYHVPLLLNPYGYSTYRGS
ncbi:MAG: hydroxyisourate hydrolase [Bdellovibrio sp. CG12_big_fil_rev_8_21_14_0_65_39_13]|nr:MAG: hydroxyisourate hydrolase [Bdellovibrio sp. CG22_combo_CG10-13_8_21_14_all_39_27]PIQ60136.1 MAG: hydroxyisourate hydrolase [Bdellovibrio sp. CG12_big_fil_rev_8_21_14_0_65_39_13]PIR36771.1 MAG: hydroxyisourate hydrolase [Bdellovibrio sp. CG11_big_fil_rev_8_21_14_0_20_39_38]PJB53192.1 MAG: hydroxyisourate hydrolase [Bdellovibrio sp. CG_4_9_14_3_um_filter_39_7]